jgi:hypothetical protein
MTDIDRREQLLAAKLRFIAREAFSSEGTVEGVRGGATLVADDGRGFVLLEDDPARSLGRALVWGRRSHISDLHVVVDASPGSDSDSDSEPDAAGVLARRSGWFRNPPTVWRMHDLEAERAVAAPFPPAVVPSPEAELFGALMAESGLDVVLEHGVLRGEIAGLEVARVDDEPAGPARLRVGVGRSDQDAAAVYPADRSDAESLIKARDHVRAHRGSASSMHPLNRLQPERLLRHRLLAAPEVVGATRFAPAAPVLARRNLKEPAPAVAVGADDQGRPVVAVCVWGIDLDAVAAAADARALYAPDGRLALVLAGRDRHPVLVALAEELADPAELVVAPDAWVPGAELDG